MKLHALKLVIFCGVVLWFAQGSNANIRVENDLRGTYQYMGDYDSSKMVYTAEKDQNKKNSSHVVYAKLTFTKKTFFYETKLNNAPVLPGEARCEKPFYKVERLGDSTKERIAEPLKKEGFDVGLKHYEIRYSCKTEERKRLLKNLGFIFMNKKVLLAPYGSDQYHVYVKR